MLQNRTEMKLVKKEKNALSGRVKKGSQINGTRYSVK